MNGLWSAKWDGGDSEGTSGFIEAPIWRGKGMRSEGRIEQLCKYYVRTLD